jgi:CMP-N-acetylneuraminic acid synthetase
LKIETFIFARGGSKGLPSKNTKIFHGKPLIGWAIETAFEVDEISNVIVSTDCLEIANVARQFGAEVPFIRPAEFAEDTSSEWSAWRHALEFVRNDKGYMPDAMLSLPPTAPLRSSLDVRNCLDLFDQKKPDAVITVTEAHRSPYFNMVKRNENEIVSLILDDDKRITRRQEAPEVFDITTVAYLLNAEFVMKNESLFDGRVLAVKVPLERSIDIDTQLDFDIAEFLFKRNKIENYI